MRASTKANGRHDLTYHAKSSGALAKDTEKAILAVASKPLGSRTIEVFTLSILASNTSAITMEGHYELDVFAVQSEARP